MKYFPDARFISSIRMTAHCFMAEQMGSFGKVRRKIA
jgi:hypothetical protein